MTAAPDAATLWPRVLGNCHTHRDTERAIVDAGFELDNSRREWTLPTWAPLPVSELALGCAQALAVLLALRRDCAQGVIPGRTAICAQSGRHHFSFGAGSMPENRSHRGLGR